MKKKKYLRSPGIEQHYPSITEVVKNVTRVTTTIFFFYILSFFLSNEMYISFNIFHTSNSSVLRIILIVSSGNDIEGQKDFGITRYR